MAQNSKIEWTHHTANLWHGCTKVHAGCDHCYAETLSHRWGRDIWGNDKPRMEIKSVWSDLKKYQAAAAAVNEVHRVFVGSMMDIFEKPMPLIDSKGNLSTTVDTGQLRNQFFDQIKCYPNLLFLLLTKRPSNINKYIPESWKTDPPKNVMFGTSPCDQATADTLIPQLLQVKGKHFLSIEPLLGQVNISKWIHESICEEHGRCGYCDPVPDEPKEERIDWVIVGGESGHNARPMHPEWVRLLRDHCNDAEVPFFFKQWGEFKDGANGGTPVDKWLMVGNDGSIHKDGIVPKGLHCTLMTKVGKKEAGRELDGNIYDEFPEIITV